jgi:hypothetical protein
MSDYVYLSLYTEDPLGKGGVECDLEGYERLPVRLSDFELTLKKKVLSIRNRVRLNFKYVESGNEVIKYIGFHLTAHKTEGPTIGRIFVSNGFHVNKYITGAFEIGNLLIELEGLR